jgi:uncharacterized protein (UPF0210 family)
MWHRLWCTLLSLLLLGTASSQSGSTDRNARPKIRTITAFVQLDRQNYRQQVAAALQMLRAAKQQYVAAGYDVETLRITTQSFPQIVQGMPVSGAVDFFRELDKMAQQEGFTPDIGGAMQQDSDDSAQAELLARIIAATQTINGYVVIADASGIHWNGISAAARVIKYLEDHTERGEGNFRFAAGAFPPANAPFYPVSHTEGMGHGFAIGIESAGIVNQVFAGAKGNIAHAGEQLTQELGVEAKKVEEVARRLEKMHGWKYDGIDLTPVPLKDISIGAAFESLLGAPIGEAGTLSVAYTITSALRRIPVLQTGYSGLMLPVLEDSTLARRWESGAISRDSLLSYSAVCSAGLDAVPLPGDVSQREVEKIISDVASLAVKWKKPLSTRLLPAPGKRVGDMTDFTSQYLVNIHIR